jgi:MFS transporter, YNFM family, putative membrane transport protein
MNSEEPEQIPLFQQAVEPDRVDVRTLIAIFCAAFGGFTNLYCTQSIYPTLLHLFDFSVAGAGGLLTATTLALAASALFAGRIARRFGTRRAILAGLGALALTTILFACARHQGELIALRILQGALIPIVLAALLAGMGDMGQRAGALSLAAAYTSATLLGGLAGRFLPAVLMGGDEWTRAFLAFAGLQGGLLAAVWFLYPQASSKPDLTGTSLPDWVRGLAPLLRGELLRVAVAGFCLLFAQVAITTYIAIRLAEAPFEWTTQQLGVLYAVFLPAVLSVRWTPRALAQWGAPRTLRYAMGAGWAGLALTLTSSAVLIVLGLVVFSCSVFSAQAVLARASGLASPDKREAASGLYLCLTYLGASAGALAPALTWASLGWAGCLLLIAGVQLAGYLLTEEVRGSVPR